MLRLDNAMNALWLNGLSISLMQLNITDIFFSWVSGLWLQKPNYWQPQVPVLAVGNRSSVGKAKMLQIIQFDD